MTARTSTWLAATLAAAALAGACSAEQEQLPADAGPVEVDAGPPPVPKAGAVKLQGPVSALTGVRLKFTCTATEERPLTFQFDWEGDDRVDAESSGGTAERAFTFPAIYRPRCRGSNGEGKEGAWSAPVQLTVDTNTRPVAVRITADTEHRAVALVTAAGGSVSTVAADGTEITLDVPAGALVEEQSITLTPLTVADAPLGTVLGAARLEPEGLRLLHAAALTMRPAQLVSSGRVVGFASTEGGRDFHLAPAERAGAGLVRVSLAHLGEAGAGIPDATTATKAATNLPAGAEARAAQEYVRLQLEADRTSQPTDGHSIANLMRLWFDSYVRALLQQAGGSDTYLPLALDEYTRWAVARADWNVDESLVAAESERAAELMAAALRLGVDSAEGRCRAWQDWRQAAEELRLARVAEELGLASQQQLDSDSVLAALCLAVHVDDAAFVPSAPTGSTPATLRVRADYSVGLAEHVSDPPLALVLQPSGGTLEYDSDLTRSGVFEAVARLDPGAASMSVQVRACFPDIKTHELCSPLLRVP